MRIGVDGNEANVEEPVGVSIYTLKHLQYFHKQANSDLQFKIFLRENPGSFMPEENANFKYQVIPSKSFWLQIALPARLLTQKLDIFFSPAHYSPPFFKIPLVVTIHDLSYFYYPEEFLKKDLYKLKNWTARSVKKTRKIIAVSENTKKDIIKFYKVPEEKIQVIYNGFEKQITENLEIENSFEIWKLKTEKFILYVGTLQPRKNVSFLIKVFEKFSQKNPDFKLVLVGKKGWLYDDIFELVKKLNLEDRVIFTGHIKDDELVQLYKNAFCFVMPSLYEGFCIPILEAMSYSCPVISSNTSSLPEVGTNACLYFDPTNEFQLFKQLNELVISPKTRKYLIQKGLERIKQFSWQKSSRQTLEVIKSLL